MDQRLSTTPAMATTGPSAANASTNGDRVNEKMTTDATTGARLATIGNGDPAPGTGSAGTVIGSSMGSCILPAQQARGGVNRIACAGGRSSAVPAAVEDPSVGSGGVAVLDEEFVENDGADVVTPAVLESRVDQAPDGILRGCGLHEEMTQAEVGEFLGQPV